LSGTNKYYWNDNTKSTGKCSNTLKCICKTKTCSKCPKDTYSEGGINSKCTKCPTDRPYTALNRARISDGACIKSADSFKCKDGEGVGQVIRTFDRASQCNGGVITTEAECKAAAEFNSKNNIDKNVGYEGRPSWSIYPPGCVYHSGNNKYYWNDNTKSTATCSDNHKCICKSKACNNCPINTYSTGGINKRCQPCPKDRPSTAGKTGQRSKDACVKTITCSPGQGFMLYREKGKCEQNAQVKTWQECKVVAEFNNNIYGHLNGGLHPNPKIKNRDEYFINSKEVPYGCFVTDANPYYVFNEYSNSPIQCSTKYKCACIKNTCQTCPPQYYSPGGDHIQCKKMRKLCFKRFHWQTYRLRK
jgi:hypothetical protein